MSDDQSERDRECVRDDTAAAIHAEIDKIITMLAAARAMLAALEFLIASDGHGNYAANHGSITMRASAAIAAAKAAGIKVPQ